MIKTPINHIVSITEARSRLGELVDDAIDEQFWVLTKGGKPKAALVDIDYLDYLVSLKAQINHPTMPLVLEPEKDPLLGLIGTVHDGTLTHNMDEELYG